MEENELLVTWITVEFKHLIKYITGDKVEHFFGSTFRNSISAALVMVHEEQKLNIASYISTLSFVHHNIELKAV